MESEGGKSTKKKRKINFSHVHEEYDVVDHYHPGTKQFEPSSKCKACKNIISGVNASNLKSHLKAKHNDLFLKVNSKF